MKRLTLLAVALLPAPAAAAPPTLNYLYPAGAQRGTTVEVTVDGTFDRWPVGAWADRPGVTIQPAKARGQLRVTVAADAKPGVCWIRLHDEQGASVPRPFFIGTLPEVLEREPNDAPSAPQVLKGNATVNGRLQKPGDVDVFALPLRKGQTLVASLEANRTLKSPMDAVLQVLSPEGFVLEQNDDHRGADPQIVFTAPRDGRYLVRTFAFPETPDASIRFAGAETFVYRLTLTTGGFAEHAWPLAVPRAAPGEVDVVGWNIPKAAARLGVFAVPGTDLGATFHAELANAALVRLEPHPCVVEKTPNDRKRPQRVELPVTVSGRIAQPGEIDVYEFTLKKGEKLPITIEARALDSPLDPVLRLTDGSGRLITASQVKRLRADPDLTATAASDSTFRIEVSDFHGEGSPRHLYRLRLTAGPDFALTVTNDRFALLPGKTLDIPVTVERGSGFKDEIEIVALGLPDGVTAKPVRALAGGKTAAVRLTAEGTVASGAFRIVGRVSGRPETERAARAPAPEMSAPMEYLWITLGKNATAPQPPPKKKKK